MREIDVVVWGATGYTGRLVAEAVAAQAPAGLRWALGGRDRRRLEDVRRSLGVEVETIAADALDRESVDALARRTRVVATTVGPYARYGTPLVEACVRHGTHCCDLTGEPHWIRDNVDRLHDRAAATGARIVHACGFDSIPSDLGVWMLHEHLSHAHGRNLARACFYLMKARGGASGGTAASVLDLLERAARDRGIRRVLADPYALAPPGERSGPDGTERMESERDATLGRWTAPFAMAAINTRVVRRSNALLGYPYGRDFRYEERAVTSGRWSARATSLALRTLPALGAFGPTRAVLRRLAPRPGSGPSPERRARGFFEVRLLGSSDGEPALAVRGTVASALDPGYGATARMLAASALCLALDELPERGGILTPASAMGSALLTRLRAAGFAFDVHDVGSGPSRPSSRSP